MMSLILMLYQSMLKLNCATGWITNPTLHCFDVSGWRAGLPPENPFTWAFGSPEYGSLNCSEVPSATGCHRSISVGARKPVPYEPRSSTSLIGW